MTSKKRGGLGKGLNELLSSTLASTFVMGQENKASATKEFNNREELISVAVDKIVVSPFQPRQTMRHDGLEELAESIRTQGMIQPVLVRKKGEQFELVAGERRWRAAQLAGVDMIPAIVRDIDNQAAMIMALIENIQRENLNPLEEAKALKRIADELNLTHLEVAEGVGKSRTSVTNTLRLLSLNEDVQQLLQQGQLEMGHARALLGLRGEAQSQLAQTIVERGLSVRETEKWVSELQQAQEDIVFTPAPLTADPNIRRLEEDLSDRLGAKVFIKHGRKGGKVVIHYHDVDELDGILAHIK